MKKINLCFDGRILKCGLDKSTSRTGIYFVGHNLVIEMAKRENINLLLYLPPSELALQKDIFTSLNIKELPILTDTDDFSEINAFFSPFEAIPEFIRKYPKISCYTALYDVIALKFPQYFEGKNKQGWVSELSTRLNFEDYYFSISNHTAQDFLQYFPQLDKKKITTIPLSSNFNYKPNENKKIFHKVCEKYHIPTDKKYLFSLCSLEPRKNLIRAVKTFIQFIEKNQINDLVYVLGGCAWGGFIEKFKEEVPEWQKYADKIIRAGYVDDDDLESLYSNAEWFIYTSQYEGFGMPPLEAMKCGCPVITSNNSSLPEVVGDAGIMIDYDSDEQHVAAYEKYYFNDKYRLSMARKGFKRSKQFSWKKTVDIIINQIEDVESKKNNQPLVTIVTPTFNLIKSNRKNTVQQMMESVHNQTYPNIEHLMIDGASTDGTLNLLKEYKQKGWINYYSKPDKGLYDGINKGILKAKGKYVVILNSDDFYCDNHAIEWLVAKAESTGVDACYGDAIRVNPQTLEVMNYWNGKDNFLPIFGSAACHQTFLIKTEVMKELGLYNLEYKVSADNNFFVKMLAHDKKFASVNREIIHFRDGGFSNSHFMLSEQERTDGIYEEYCKKYGLTKYDAYQLFGYKYLSLPLNEAINLGSRLLEPKWIYSYFSKLIEYNKSQSSQVSVTQTTTTVPQGYGFGIKVYKLFDLIPLLKIAKKDIKIKYTLLGFIPLYKHKRIGELNYWKILGICVLKKRQFLNGRIKYYLFGLPIILRKHTRQTERQRKIYEKIDNEYTKQIKIFNITIYRKIKATPPKLPIYNFSKENGNIELKGFFEKEDWGRWSNGDECSISFLNYNAKIAVFDIQPFLHENHSKTEVNVYVNDKQQATWIFELGKKQPDTRISLSQFKKNNIIFEIKNPVSPKEVGINDDIRRISLGFRSVEFKEETIKKPKTKLIKYPWIFNVIDDEYIKQVSILNFLIYRRIKKELPKSVTYEFNKENPVKKEFFLSVEMCDNEKWNGMKKKICISGNCVTEKIPLFLKTNHNFTTLYDMDILKPIHTVTKDDVDDFKKSVMTCDVFLTQPISGHKYIELGIDTESLKKIMKPTAKLFLMPVPYFKGYFPEQFYLHDNIGSLVGTHEGLPSPYHNKIIFWGYTMGKSVEEVYDFLYNNNNMKNIDKLVIESLSELSRREEYLAFRISDFILENYSDKRLFWTINHPSNIMIQYIASEILRILGIKKYFWQRRPTVKKIPEECLAEYVTPILPSITNQLKLKNMSTKENTYTKEYIQQYYNYYKQHKELVLLNKDAVEEFILENLKIEKN